MNTWAAVNTIQVSDPISKFKGTDDIMSEHISPFIFQPIILKKVKWDFSASHYWHVRVDGSLMWEVILYTVEYLVTPLTSTN